MLEEKLKDKAREKCLQENGYFQVPVIDRNGDAYQCCFLISNDKTFECPHLGDKLVIAEHPFREYKNCLYKRIITTEKFAL